MQSNNQTNSQNLNESPGNQEEKSEEEVLDEVLAELDEYIKDPSKVTVETLTNVRDQLTNLKESMMGEGDQETASEGEQGMNGNESKHRPLSVIISMMGGKHK